MLLHWHQNVITYELSAEIKIWIGLQGAWNAHLFVYCKHSWDPSGLVLTRECMLFTAQKHFPAPEEDLITGSGCLFYVLDRRRCPLKVCNEISFQHLTSRNSYLLSESNVDEKPHAPKIHGRKLDSQGYN